MKKFHPIRGKNVHIIFQSQALGDTLAWFPYVEQFRVDNKCNVKLFLPMQELIPLLKPNYPKIEFLSEEKYMHARYAVCEHGCSCGDGEIHFKLPMNADGIISYKIGCSWDGRQYIPLQQSATEILGLPFVEKRPNLVFKNYGRPMKEKYVCIGVHTGGPQLKYWNYPKGWNYVVRYLNHKGYKVLDIDLEEDQSRDGYINELPKGAIKSQGKPLEERVNELMHSEFFIGLSSGLSWLAWALNKRTIMIGGFTSSWYEFQHKCIRVRNDKVCNSCWHRDESLNLKGEWNLCPEHKGTEREFECSKEIDPSMVFSAIDKVISDSRK
ncbi:autotransporter strand-loop-strand O-heptosyltransferase [Candidatus Pacearchaeota archaeon]|nr:autotransporter strand-loop-strand O-heptosyltransferase [Candidatus Pacearchaeota archaeon]